MTPHFLAQLLVVYYLLEVENAFSILSNKKWDVGQSGGLQTCRIYQV